MKRAILTLAFAGACFVTHAQALIGESGRIVTTYLDLRNIQYRAVYNSQHQAMFVKHDMEGGTVVYYFENDSCIEYSVVKYDCCPDEVANQLDRLYPKDGNKWCADAENAYIQLAIAGNAVFINTLSN